VFIKKIKLLLVLVISFIICGCGKKGVNDVIKSFEKKVNSVKSYSITGLMEITSNEETYSYDVFVDYKYEDYYKVTLVNKINDHEQIILKNDDGVYVVTPALNKSFKFQSEWPLNSSQSYLLKSLVNDIKNTEDPKVEKYLRGETISYEGNEKGWILVCVDRYPLGFGKIQNHTIKNKLEKGFRKL